MSVLSVTCLVENYVSACHNNPLTLEKVFRHVATFHIFKQYILLERQVYPPEILTCSVTTSSHHHNHQCVIYQCTPGVTVYNTS